MKGAFTDAKTDRAGRFELADESTLFMDEIANVPMNQQAKLLRVIETGEFERVGSSKTLHANVRIISATNANPHEEVAAGRFRQDLLFRLNTIEIALPPLRERREDIMPLANTFSGSTPKRYRKKLTGFEEAAREVLMQHQFPGNVRELDHVIERAVLMTQGPQIKANDLGLTTCSDDSPRLEDMSLEEVEAFLIKKALARHRWQRAQGGRSVGAEPERLLSPAPALWSVSGTSGERGLLACPLQTGRRVLRVGTGGPPASTSQPLVLPGNPPARVSHEMRAQTPARAFA